MSDNKNFSFEIKEKYAVLSTNGNESKEFNKVSYRGYTPKYDLRTWINDNGEKKLGKGITLSEDEFKILKKAILNMEI